MYVCYFSCNFKHWKDPVKTSNCAEVIPLLLQKKWRNCITIKAFSINYAHMFGIDFSINLRGGVEI